MIRRVRRKWQSALRKNLFIIESPLVNINDANDLNDKVIYKVSIGIHRIRHHFLFAFIIYF